MTKTVLQKWRMKVAFLGVGQQISLALLSSWRTDNKFGVGGIANFRANTFRVDPFPQRVIPWRLLKAIHCMLLLTEIWQCPLHHAVQHAEPHAGPTQQVIPHADPTLPKLRHC